MLKYVYVSPSDFLVVLLGRGVARIAVGGDGRGDHARGRACSPWASRSISAAVDWPLLVVVMVARPRRDRRRSGSSSRRSASRPARSRGRTRRPWPAPCSSSAGAVFPLSVLPAPLQARRPAHAAHLVDRGDPAGALPRRPHLDRRRRARSSRRSPDGRPRAAWRSSSPCWRPGRWLHSPPSLYSGRAIAERRIAGCSTRRPAPEPGRPRDARPGAQRRPDADLRGKPAPGLRGGLPFDRRVHRSARDARVLLVEAPDGFIVQGIVAAGAAGGAWSESIGSQIEGDAHLPRR